MVCCRCCCAGAAAVQVGVAWCKPAVLQHDTEHWGTPPLGLEAIGCQMVQVSVCWGLWCVLVGWDGVLQQDTGGRGGDDSVWYGSGGGVAGCFGGGLQGGTTSGQLPQAAGVCDGRALCPFPQHCHVCCQPAVQWRSHKRAALCFASQACAVLCCAGTRRHHMHATLVGWPRSVKGVSACWCMHRRG